MKWLVLLAGVVAVCLIAAVALGWVAGGMGGPGSTLSHEPLPDERLDDEALEELRFDVTARGYRMSQVDGVVDRLRRELRDRDDEIAVLRAELDRADPDRAELVRADPDRADPDRPELDHTETRGTDG